MLSIFSCDYWPSVYLLWRNIYLGLLPIFQLGYLIFLLLLSCMNCLYIFEIKPLSVTLFADIFSQFIGCLFILLMVSFAVKELLSLIGSHLFLLLFLLHIGRLTKENVGVVYVREGVAYVFF